jgi:hypothetical protein
VGAADGCPLLRRARAARVIPLVGRAAVRIAHDAGGAYTAGYLLRPRAPRVARRPSSRAARGRFRRLPTGLGARAARVI